MIDSAAHLLAQAAGKASYLDRYVFDGGVMMAFLIPTSVLAAGAALQNFISLRKGRVLGSRKFRAACLELAKAKNLRDLETLLERAKRVALARVVRKGLAGGHVPGPAESVDLVRAEVARLFRGAHPLSVIFHVAPYMGILGTVIGLMGAFEEYASSKTDLLSLSANLNTALVTTIWGLAIAVPSYVFFHLFRARLIRAEEDWLPEEAEKIFRPLREASKRPGPPATEPETLPEAHPLGASPGEESDLP